MCYGGVLLERKEKTENSQIFKNVPRRKVKDLEATSPGRKLRDRVHGAWRKITRKMLKRLEELLYRKEPRSMKFPKTDAT